MSTIRVIKVEPLKEPKVMTIDNGLKELQESVGGLIEQYMPFADEDIAIICNDEGKMLGMDLNRAIYDEHGEIMDIIAGNFIICYAPYDSEQYESLSDEMVDKYMEIFKAPEMFIQNAKTKEITAIKI